MTQAFAKESRVIERECNTFVFKLKTGTQGAVFED